MKNTIDKSKIIAHIKELLEQKIDALSLQIKNTELSQQNDTKSSAGDKFETGREMLQAELNKYEGQRANLQQSLKALLSISSDYNPEKAEFGSLIESNKGLYFMAIGLGKIELEGSVVFAISLAAPIGQVLHNARVGDTVRFQGREISVMKIL